MKINGSKVNHLLTITRKESDNPTPINEIIGGTVKMTTYKGEEILQSILKVEQGEEENEFKFYLGDIVQ